MTLSKSIKEKTRQKFARSEKDTGSTGIQIALLTERINLLTKHFKNHKKDFHSQVGLMKIVSRRKKLLAYIKKKSLVSYHKIINQLNLRK